MLRGLLNFFELKLVIVIKGAYFDVYYHYNIYVHGTVHLQNVLQE